VGGGGGAFRGIPSLASLSECAVVVIVGARQKNHETQGCGLHYTQALRGSPCTGWAKEGFEPKLTASPRAPVYIVYQTYLTLEMARVYFGLP